MKKKVAVVLSAFLMLFALVACGGGTGLEGKWKMTGATGGDMAQFAEFEKYGAIYFNIKGGKIALELETGSSLSEEEKLALEMIKPFLSSMEMSYEVLSDTEMKLTISGLGQSATETVEYSLNGDTLILDDATFTRQ